MRNFIFFLLCFPMYLFSQSCQYLAYEGFNYGQNSPLHGQYGGVGWANTWEVQSNDVSVPGFTGATSSPMIWSNLLGFGNYIVGGNNYLTIGRRLNLSNTGPFAPYLTGTGRVGQAGTTLYMSVLLRKEYNNDQIAAAMLQGGNNVPWVTNQDPRAVVGYFGAASNVGGIAYWGMAVNGTIYNTSTPVTVGATTLLVMRIAFGNGTHTLSLWVNPATIGASMPTPQLTQTIVGTLEFNAFAAYLGNTNQQVAMDEIRLGGSYECVVPDNTTTINVPPDAAFSTNVNGGIAPVMVTFNASASVDIDGTLQNYIWQFGDGTRDTTLSPTISHTYTTLGQIAPTLTVTDNGGLQHTAYGTITITNGNGNYPCFSSVHALAKASCGQNNGSFQVNPGNANYSLYNVANQLIPTSSTPTIYDNLAVGQYTLYINSAQGCRDTLRLYIETDSTTCIGWASPTCLNMGINLDYVNYYDHQRMFKNFRLDAADWVTYNVTSPTPWTPWNTNVYNEIPMDANGYPTQVPFASSIGQQGLRMVFSADGHLPIGNYTFWYDGDGVLELNGASITSQQAGRIDFSVSASNTTIWVNIASSTLGNHIRNIRILRPGDELTYQASPFYQPFLDKLAPFSTIRFVEATATNPGVFLPVNWADRLSPQYYTQGGYRGMSYEMIIQLANATNKNVWINIPHTASNDYMQQMAVLFRDNLNANLEIYLEYSNEVWNWQFAQAHFVSDNGAQNISYPRRYAERCKNAYRIWSQIFGGQMSRLHRVINTQMGNAWYGEQVLAHLAPTDYDYLSPTWYFGYSGSPCQATFDASTTPQQIIDCMRQFFLSNAANMRQDYLTASLFGKETVNYEGGQHATDGTFTPYIQAVWDAQLHPDMYNLYNQVLDSLKRWGPLMSNAYNLARTNETQYGSFGHLTDIDLLPTMTNAPKWMALMDNICPLYNNPLPIEMSHFIVNPYKNEAAQIQWHTSSELQVLGFELQKSENGIDFYPIAWMDSKGQAGGTYLFWDRNLLANQRYYYRLKQIDNDGHFSFSETRTCVLFEKDDEIILYPNPTSGNIELNGKKGMQIKIFDISGLLIWETITTEPKEQIDLTFCPAGFYFIQIDGKTAKVAKY